MTLHNRVWSTSGLCCFGIKSLAAFCFSAFAGGSTTTLSTWTFQKAAFPSDGNFRPSDNREDGRSRSLAFSKANMIHCIAWGPDKSSDVVTYGDIIGCLSQS